MWTLSVLSLPRAIAPSVRAGFSRFEQRIAETGFAYPLHYSRGSVWASGTGSRSSTECGPTKVMKNDGGASVCFSRRSRDHKERFLRHHESLKCGNLAYTLSISSI